MNDDAVLLRRYAEEGSENAFTELVRRHVDLVYGAALRRTNGDAHRAADVAQQVFTTLAREARKLARHTVLGAWLHTATRNAALNLMISEQRRQNRERAALDSAIAGSDAGPDWETLRPVLDAAIDELPEPDRAAVVLRFLERRGFSDIGAALHVSEDAARMRTDRALEKLRAALARRGITSTAAALGAMVASQPVVAAPAGLAAALATQSFTAAAGTGLIVTLNSFMNLKLISVAALAAIVAFFIGNTTASKPPAASPPPTESPQQAKLIASLQQDNDALKAEAARLKADLERVDAANTQLMKERSAPVAPVAVAGSPNIGMPLYQLQREVLNNLKQINVARTYFKNKNGAPAGSVNDLVGVKSLIKTVRTVGGENYAALSMDPTQPMTVTTPDGVSVTLDPTGATTTQIEVPSEVVRVQDLSAKVLKPSTKALEAYRLTHGGAMPPNEDAIVPYFINPMEAADFTEFLKAKRAAGL